MNDFPRRQRAAVAAWLVSLVSAGCPPAAQTEETGLFTDITQEAGVSWLHFNGESEDRHLIESTCAGVGFVDFDRDGDLDIFLVNGGETPRGRSSRPVRHGLYRNLGGSRFEDVADRAGVASLGLFGMGVAVGDFDNDGYDDLFVTGHPRSALLRNSGRGSYVDVSDQAGIRNGGEWSASAAWFDYDRDSFVDLFVTNYAALALGDPPRCEYRGRPVYCAQTAYSGREPTLYRNNGDGTFADVTAQAGLAGLKGRALGVVTVDVDDDGWQDVFVARDASPNLLLMNRRNGTFEDRALEAEVAYSQHGVARSGMGVDAGDFNGNGRPDFTVTNFDSEFHALYINRGSLPFDEVTVWSGLGRHSRPYVGWGTSFLDYDRDGDLDLATANGHINHMIELTRHDVKYRQPLLLLESDAGGKLEDARASAGEAFDRPGLYRGLAVGDIDNDGDPDMVVTRLGGSPMLLRNNSIPAARWIGLELEGTRSNRNAIGAKVSLRTGNGVTMVRWIKGGGSFLASSDRRVLFGLGQHVAADGLAIEIRWPSGFRQSLEGLPAGRYHRVTEPKSAE